jgi:hypothetical protein
MSDYDAITIIFVMLVFGVCLLLADFVIVSFQTGNVLCMFEGVPNPGCQQSLAYGREGLAQFSSLFIVVYAGILVSSIIMATQVESAPMFFMLTLVLNLVIFFVAPIASNIYFAIYNQPAINAVSDQHTNELWFFQNLPLIAVFTSIIIAVFTHGKPTRRGGVPEGF